MNIFLRFNQLFNRDEVDMTKGPVLRHIIIFSFPLLLGNLFQQLYGTVDTWIVGKYVNNEAFSALGGIMQVLNMIIGFFMGLSTGVEVFIARCFGANDKERVNRGVHTAILMNLWVTFFITVIGIAIIPAVLKLMNAPIEVRPYAVTYLTIYFGSAVSLTFYNLGSAILRAVGDSFRPFCYLALTTILNIVLDFVFVAFQRWGVAGVAYATVLSQSVSAVLVIVRLIRVNTCIKIQPKNLHLDWKIQKEMLKTGVPIGLQTAITAASNIFLNSYIYYHGVDCMSGWAAYDKLINFMHLPALSVSYAITSCIGQNYGSGRMDRVKECVKKAMLLGVALSFATMIIYEIFAVDLISLFQSKKEVVDYGVLFLRAISPCYIFAGTAVFYSAAARGLGNSLTPMLVTVGGYVGFRQLFMLFATHILHNDSIIFLIIAYDFSWVFCTIIQRFIFKREYVKIEKEINHG